MRRLKELPGLSFAKLAARTHYSRSTREGFLNGKRPVPREAVEQFASAVRSVAGVCCWWRKGNPGDHPPSTAAALSSGPTVGQPRWSCLPRGWLWRSHPPHGRGSRWRTWSTSGPRPTSSRPSGRTSSWTGQRGRDRGPGRLRGGPRHLQPPPPALTAGVPRIADVRATGRRPRRRRRICRGGHA
ncbi:helix-turn-helix domain-containing protein [Streptomyces bluensis]|uniref:Helix-turn-helix domain-containing protein n=1 Tax=Streptomyces bluensis TaxID=33897 RepID=A0ABW6UGU7_9ACTN